MAAAAETLDRQTHEFDWAFAEAQFAAVPQHVQAPQKEIYGRSLSTMRLLGAFAVCKSAPKIINSPEAQQAKAEFFTSVEEGFGTDMELGGGLEVRDFDRRCVKDGKALSKRFKTAVSDMTAAGLICAEDTAIVDRAFAPQLTRSKWDHANALIVDQMVQGKTGYNTRIVVSPFPEEAAAQNGDEYWKNIGYVPHLKRGFVQLYHLTDNGQLLAGSLSFDGSDKQQLREVFAARGIIIPEAEITDNWLQYAITDNLSEAEAKTLGLEIADQAADPLYQKNTNTVDVTSEYHVFMDRVFNDSYIHACESLERRSQTPETQKLILELANKAGDFNDRYAKALYEMQADKQRFTNDDMVVIHELLVYSTIELMRALHLQKTKAIANEAGLHRNVAHIDVAQLRTLNSQVFQGMLGGFGAAGARSNRIYAACGLKISLGGQNLEDANNPQAAFGGTTKSMESNGPQDKYGSLKFKCKNGHWNERPRNKLITKCCVTSCKNSVSC